MKARRSSMITSFSWWQCIGRSWLSAATRTPGWRARRPSCRSTSPRPGRKSGSGAPAQASTYTSTRAPSSRKRSPRLRCEGPRSSSKAAVKNQPARKTRSRASRSARTITGSASAPSTKISISCPGRGGAALCDQGEGAVSRMASWPIFARRRRWCIRTALSTWSPTQESIVSATSARPVTPGSDLAVASIRDRVHAERDQAAGHDEQDRIPYECWSRRASAPSSPTASFGV